MYSPENLFISRDLYITEKNFIASLNAIIEQYCIDFVIPTHDTIARFLAENNQAINAVIVGSPSETAYIAENKKLIYQGISGSTYCPEIYSEDKITYPAFLKPLVAAGGKGTAIVRDSSDLSSYSGEYGEYLLCEYLPGREYTVDCFTDSERRLLFAGPRTRQNITNGIAYHSERVELTDEMRDIAEDLNKRFVFRGTWYFQVKEDINGKLKLMEFSVRSSGTMTYWRHLGVNFPLLSLFDAMGYHVEIICNDLDIKLDRGIETLFSIQYDYDYVYLDYDDTLIVNGLVNTNLMKFIYQCINEGKKIVLLTAHEGDLYESMREHRISPELFDQITAIPLGVRKSGYIRGDRAIFIDNYFPERLDASRKLNIPVFDVDAFSCLIK